MAKKSWIARDKKKADTVKRYAELRTQLKAEKDYIGLTMLPRNASPTRTVNRCLVSGRRNSKPRRHTGQDWPGSSGFSEIYSYMGIVKR